MFLRPALIEDAAALAELGRASFCAAFAHLYSGADLASYLAMAYTAETAAREIADPAYLHCLAEDAPSNELAAFCKMRHPSTYNQEFPGHSDAANPIAISQLYCDPARTGEGLGAKLMEWALDQARSLECDAVQLSVWAENYGAQKFYQRYGFKWIADIHFMVGEQRDDELLYELPIVRA